MEEEIQNTATSKMAESTQKRGNDASTCLDQRKKKRVSGAASITDCLKLMSEIPGMTCEDSLFMLGKEELFLKPEKREVFVSLDSPQLRLAWLKQERRFECSIGDCLRRLSETPGIIPGDPLYFLGIDLLEKREKREIFVALSDAGHRLAWLKQEVEYDTSPTLLIFTHFISYVLVNVMVVFWEFPHGYMVGP